MAQAYSKLTMPGLIGLNLKKVVKETSDIISHISYHRVSLGCAEEDFTKRCRSIQKRMQLWTEINVLTSDKLMQTMLQQMHAAFKAKGGQMKYKTV